jgi:hypothetical protein
MSRRFGLDRRETWVFLALALGAAFVLLALLGLEPNLLKPDGDSKSLGTFIQKVNDVKGPATIALGSVGFCGMLAGGGLLALGQQTGVRIMGMSAGALAGVFLGNGLIQ